MATEPVILEVVRFFDGARSLVITDLLDIERARTLFDEIQRMLGVEADESDLLEAEKFFIEARTAILESGVSKLEAIQEAAELALAKDGINFLEVFGIKAKETPQSRFLSWLLNPDESHGLGESFLTAFMDQVQLVCQREESLDLSGVIITREKSGETGTPDIVIEGTNFICVIENKIFAQEGNDQTGRYAREWRPIAEARNLDEPFLIFLTPIGTDPQSPYFRAMTYSSLLDSLEQAKSVTTGAANFMIDQFIWNLRKNILKETAAEERCLRIGIGYRELGDRYLLDHFDEICALHEKLEV